MPALRRSRAGVVAAAVLSTTYAMARAGGWPRSSDRLATPAIDLWSAVWAPVRGLLSGYDVYADNGAYLHAFHVPYGASAHPPFVLLLLAPLSGLSLARAWALFMVITIACIWAALWLLASPVTPGQHLLVATAGVILVCGGIGEFLLQVGQLTGLALLGLALVVKYPKGRRGVAGVLLLTVVPQTAVPMTIMLARGRGRTMLRGWALAGLLSVPPLIVVGVNAGGLGAVAHSLASTVRRPGQTAPSRVDLPGLLIGHDFVIGLLLLIATATVVIVRRVSIGPDNLWALFVAVMLTTLLWYHRPYDLILPGVVLAAVVIRSPHVERVALVGIFLAGCVLSAGPTASWRDALTGMSGKPSWHVVTAALPILLVAVMAIAWLVRFVASTASGRGADPISPRRASSDPSAPCP